LLVVFTGVFLAVSGAAAVITITAIAGTTAIAVITATVAIASARVITGSIVTAAIIRFVRAGAGTNPEAVFNRPGYAGVIGCTRISRGVYFAAGRIMEYKNNPTPINISATITSPPAR
jgi:hypothetical protein